MTMTSHTTVGLLGATSPAGRQIMRMLTESGHRVIALSRTHPSQDDGQVQWVQVVPDMSPENLFALTGEIQHWIVVSHIWVIEQYQAFLSLCKAKRIVCISSTSQFTKTSSSNPYEEELVQKLINGERQVREWCATHNIGWTILRPTLIYGRSTDRNLSEIVRLIRKWGFFPLLGGGKGLRQPIYVDDVARACIQALWADAAMNKAYNISGAEQLTYKEMVKRVFQALGKPPRLINIPMPAFNVALFFLRLIPKYKNWNADMVLRMNKDMIFDHDDARSDFDFTPQSFFLQPRDIE
ncbi:NAD-dependent epimerase/dehydratase family protein [Alcaligenes aquatilis]|uniref:NAD-dependent epimerase/dehydratase family protein n=1 Tax=Alcaligenes aquatilis TaxID=323284 RepID=A0A3G2HYK0_9BURK|nr:NAD-dependent epimerase/dehydratase family protein [Alcaligenes aquatilis]AYN22220.1 NAD-dependent epimerase/dehydratase family protein [Alcaligenes aquatilis]